MSSAVYPTLPGLDATYTKTPEFSTLIQASVTGREVRVGQRVYPMWNHNLKYNFLRANSSYPELQQLGGFWLARSGALDSFLLQDPEDYQAVVQPIGVGDGSTTSFQLLRAFGTYVEPVFYPSNTPQVYLDGVLQTSGVTLGTLGQITFATHPAIGQVITATFNYYYRSRFSADTQDFEHFMWQLWEVGKVLIRSSLQDKLA